MAPSRGVALMRYWVIRPDGRDAIGPFDIHELKKVSGFCGDTLVAPDGATDANAWRPARSYPDIQQLFMKPPPLPPRPPVSSSPVSPPPRSLPIPAQGKRMRPRRRSLPDASRSASDSKPIWTKPW